MEHNQPKKEGSNPTNRQLDEQMKRRQSNNRKQARAISSNPQLLQRDANNLVSVQRQRKSKHDRGGEASDIKQRRFASLSPLEIEDHRRRKISRPRLGSSLGIKKNRLVEKVNFKSSGSNAQSSEAMENEYPPYYNNSELKHKVPHSIEKFIFLEFSNGCFNERLLQKFQEDEQFRKFVLTQFVKQQAHENGLKAAKEPHPQTIEENEKESYRPLSDIVSSQNSKHLSVVEKCRASASPRLSDSDHNSKLDNQSPLVKQQSQFKNQQQYPAVMQACPIQEESKDSSLENRNAIDQKGKQEQIRNKPDKKQPIVKQKAPEEAKIEEDQVMSPEDAVFFANMDAREIPEEEPNPCVASLDYVWQFNPKSSPCFRRRPV